MKLSDVVKIIADGIQPVVRFNEDVDGTYIEKGMMGKILAAVVDNDPDIEEDLVKFTIDFAPYEHMNVLYETRNWLDSTTGMYTISCREAGCYKQQDDVWCSALPNDDFNGFDIIQDDRLKIYEKYIQSNYVYNNTKTYIEWLEDLVTHHKLI